ncbi:MAG: hypothetical protein ACXAEI_05505, partial [Candidatus Hodarchaeales archaeon]
YSNSTRHVISSPVSEREGNNPKTSDTRKLAKELVKNVWSMSVHAMSESKIRPSNEPLQLKMASNSLSLADLAIQNDIFPRMGSKISLSLKI